MSLATPLSKRSTLFSEEDRDAKRVRQTLEDRILVPIGKVLRERLKRVQQPEVLHFAGLDVNMRPGDDVVEVFFEAAQKAPQEVQKDVQETAEEMAKRNEDPDTRLALLDKNLMEITSAGLEEVTGAGIYDVSDGNFALLRQALHQARAREKGKPLIIAVTATRQDFAKEVALAESLGVPIRSELMKARGRVEFKFVAKGAKGYTFRSSIYKGLCKISSINVGPEISLSLT